MKIILADDHELIRKGLSELVRSMGAQVQVIEADSLGETLLLLKEQPDIDLVLLDLYLPGACGLSGLEMICRAYPAVSVAIISSEENPFTVQRAIEMGASGYIPKSTCNRVLLKALELIIAGGVYLPLQAFNRALEHRDASEPEVTVSPREEYPLSEQRRAELARLSEAQQQVLRMIGQGASNQEIAAQSGYALQTVKNQVSRILRSLNLANRTEAALLARQYL